MRPIAAYVAGVCLLFFLLVCRADGQFERPKPSFQKNDLPLKEFKNTQRSMGVDFKISLFTKNGEEAEKAFKFAKARIDQLDRRFNKQNPESELSKLVATRLTSKPVSISRDMTRILKAGLKIATESNGHYDFTVGSVNKLWKEAMLTRKMPLASQIGFALKSAGFKKIALSTKNRSVMADAEDMRFNLDGIVHGFAADECLRILKNVGSNRALVEVAGRRAIGDPPPGKKGWRVEIKNASPKKSVSVVIEVANCGIGISGNAFEYVSIGSSKYSYIVNPKTGIGLDVSGTVCVIGKDATTADALASAVCVMGPVRGKDFLNKRKDTEGLFAHRHKNVEGRWSLFMTKDFPFKNFKGGK